jgi:tRNA dimethylallyltransferase
MDIGTAKPSESDRRRVQHHLLDTSEPGQTVSAAEYKLWAQAAIRSVEARGHLSLLVGGSGLYVYSVLYDFQFPAGPRTQQRARLESQSLESLVGQLQQLDPERAGEIDLLNKRRVVRALETLGQPRQKRLSLGKDVLLLGLRLPTAQLERNIERRTTAMLKAGLVEEVRGLVRRYGNQLEVFRSPGYAEVIDYLDDKISLPETEQLINLHTRQLARRQITWFKRNPEIIWLEQPDEAQALVQRFLKA